MARRRTNIFYGYPSQPPTIGEAINAAIGDLKERQDISVNRLRFRPWPTLRASGKVLAQAVIDNIDRCDVFACDLTYPNDNVSFELGYAIGKFKRIFVSLDTSIEQSVRLFKRNYINLVGLGYSSYENHRDLADALVHERPWDDTASSVLSKRYRQPLARPELPTLFYVKPEINSPSVIRTVELLKASRFGETLIIDDPRDNPSASLDWYAEQLATADAVVIHLLSREHSHNSAHNLKASLIAGLAVGLKRPLLMLAHSPYESPVDYAHLLKVHETAESCIQITSNWLDEVTANLPHRRPRRPREASRTNLELRHVSLGQPVAEHERDNLDNYFVETVPYFRALEGPTTILIGRRGTGKTAILYALQANLERIRGNHVTILNPVGYELEGLIRVLQDIMHSSERGFLIESLWKYLIYSEIALSVEDALLSQPIHQERTPSETDFLAYCESNSQVIRHPFSVRLDIAVRSLDGISCMPDPIHQRSRISERLHATLLRDLRKHIGSVLASHKRLDILIDNLDSPWSPGAHVTQLAELIRGLLNVVQDIPRDLKR